MPFTMYGVQRGQDATILNGASASSAVDLFDCQLVGIAMPSVWDAADLAFQVAIDGNPGDNASYRDLYFKGQRVTIQVAASQHVSFDADTVAKFQGARHIKMVSWDSGGGIAVNQATAGNRTIIPMVARSVNF